MKNIVTGMLLFVGSVLMLWGPFLLQANIPNWGAVMGFGVLVLLGAILNFWLCKDRG